jgi:hypothetical protein
MGHLILRAFVTPRFAVPIALAVLAACVWWGGSAYRLARQIAYHTPTPMKFADAVEASRSDTFIYVRFDDATVACDKTLQGEKLGTTYALIRADGRIAAMMRGDGCDPNQHTFEGVFRHPPNGLYGAAVQYWGQSAVMQGHLSLFDSALDTRDDWVSAGLALLVGALTIASVIRTLRNDKTRALGFALVAMSVWLAHVGHEMVIFEVVPLPLFAIFPGGIGAAMALFPQQPYLRGRVEHILGERLG